MTRRIWLTGLSPTAAAALGLVACVLTACGESSTSTRTTTTQAQVRPVTVMTRNLYLGADLGRATMAKTVPELLAATATIFDTVRHTNFPERAKALAREIVDADPVLIGVQEAALWQSGPFNDPAPAGTVEYDFLAILRQELAGMGRPYDVVKVQPEADVEAPAGAPYQRDFRLVQHDAILVKAGGGDDVTVTNAQSGNFAANLTITSGTGQQSVVKRGWVSVDATVGKRPFRFVTTHLEAFDPTIRDQQAKELVAPTGPVGSAPGKVVLVGDLNSGPELPVPANRLAFSTLTAAGLVDTWAVANPGKPGFTAGFSERLDDPSPDGALENRIDHVMTKGEIGTVASQIYGTDPAKRAAGGLWPSDHAGVAATLTL